MIGQEQQSEQGQLSPKVSGTKAITGTKTLRVMPGISSNGIGKLTRGRRSYQSLPSERIVGPSCGALRTLQVETEDCNLSLAYARTQTVNGRSIPAILPAWCKPSLITPFPAYDEFGTSTSRPKQHQALVPSLDADRTARRRLARM